MYRFDPCHASFLSKKPPLGGLVLDWRGLCDDFRTLDWAEIWQMLDGEKALGYV